jgi:hypothetical protein
MAFQFAIWAINPSCCLINFCFTKKMAGKTQIFQNVLCQPDLKLKEDIKTSTPLLPSSDS